MDDKLKASRRDELIALAAQAIDARDKGQPHCDLIERFHSLAACPRVDELFESDMYPEYIVEYALGLENARRALLTREQLIAVVDDIVNSRGSEAEVSLMVQSFLANCRHPGRSDLIFYPEDYFNGCSDPSPSEIVDKAISSE